MSFSGTSFSFLSDERIVLETLGYNFISSEQFGSLFPLYFEPLLIYLVIAMLAV